MRPNLQRLAIPSSVFALALAFFGTCATPVHAADIQKADNTSSLTLNASWTGNIVPTSTDNIVVSGLTASRTAGLGGNLSVNGINFTSSNQFQISATAGANLTIGSAGITKTGSAALIIASNVTLSANQTWAINTVGGQNLQINGGFYDAGYTLNVTTNSTGTLDLRTAGSATFGSNVTIGANVSVNNSTANVTLGGTNTMTSLAIPNGRVNISTIGNFGVASNAGTGGTSQTISLGGSSGSGVFNYIGSGSTSNRTFTLDGRSSGSGIDANGTGNLTISGSLLSTGAATGNTNWNFGGSSNLILSGTVNGNQTFYTGVTKSGTGELQLAGSNNLFQGKVLVTNGTVSFLTGNSTATGNQSLGRASAIDLGVASTSSGTLKYSGTGTGTLAKTVNVLGHGNDTLQNGSATGAFDVTGTIALGSNTLTLDGGTQGLNLKGSVTSSAGTLRISAGSIGLGSANLIGDTTKLNLAGGTFSLGGLSETVDTLALTGNSTIDLGSGGVLTFGDSSGISWTNGMVLSIAGTFVSGSSIQFGTSSSGLTGTQISQISIAGWSNLGINSQGFLTATAPIPEPSTYALLAGCAVLGAAAWRRRSRRLEQKSQRAA